MNAVPLTASDFSAAMTMLLYLGIMWSGLALAITAVGAEGKWLRVTGLGSAILAFTIGAGHIPGGGMPGDPLTGSPTFWQWGIQQGALALLLMLGGWMYRRDFLKVIDQDRAYIQALVGLVSENTAAMQKQADATETNTEAIERLRHTLTHLEAKRRGFSPLADET